jgi:hypothetical protein
VSANAEPDEGYQERVSGYVTATLMILRDTLRDPEQTYRDVVMMTPTQKLELISGLSVVTMSFVNSVAETNGLSMDQALSYVATHLLDGDQD